MITFNVRYEDLAAGKSPYQGSANGYLHLVAALPGIKALDGRPDVRAAFAELQKLGASLPRPPIKVEA